MLESPLVPSLRQHQPKSYLVALHNDILHGFDKQSGNAFEVDS